VTILNTIGPFSCYSLIAVGADILVTDILFTDISVISSHGLI